VIVDSAMADPIVIAHMLGERGERFCGAPDATMSVDLTVDVAARARWDGTAVVRCGRCDKALRESATPSANERVAVAAA
jgi:hypothetical protein